MQRSPTSARPTVKMEGIESMSEHNGDHRDDSSSSVSEIIGESDGIINHENEELRDRVMTLEKKVQQQEDEIVCLKSALSDVIRRLTSVEAGRASSNALLPNKPNFRSPSGSRRSSAPVSARDAQTPRRAASHDTLNSPARYTSPTPNQVVPRAGGGGGSASRSMRKWPSSPSTAIAENTSNGRVSPSRQVASSGRASPGPMSPVSQNPTLSRRSGSLSSLQLSGRVSPFPTRVKEPTFNAEDGIMRFYLRGRAISLYAPSNIEDYQINKLGDAPSDKLKLEWVYGYRGRDARSNLFLLPTGEMVYFIASVVVLYNVEEQMQRHYLGHNDDVKCLAVHPDRITIATGQVAGHDRREGKRRMRDYEFLETAENWQHSHSSRKKDKSQPHIRIWDSVSLNTLKVIGIGEFDRAVACLGFSKADGGQYLAAVDEANEHVLSLWDWNKGEKGYKITETKSSTEPVLAAEFHPCEKNVIVTCGKSQLSFWNMEGGTLTRKQGIYEKHEKPKFVTCLAFAENGDTLTGDSNGNIYIWGRGSNKISHALTGAHDGGIFSICVMKDGTVLSGGKDRRIVQWDASYKKTGHEHEIPEQYGPIRMLSQGKGNLVIVGTTKNCILQGSLDLKFSAIIQGHMDELWGLATHPNQHQFLTCGYDGLLYLWDTLTHTAIWCKDIPDGAHSAGFHPDGNVVVIGTSGPRWMVLDIETRDVISTHTDGNEQIEVVQFSPDGKAVALGSRDNNIYVYNVDENGRKYNRIGRCSGHSSFVTHVDWSVDNQYLQTNSGDYEVLFWNASTCRQVTSASSLRDTEWASHSCTLGFNVCGIWPEGADGTDVNACARSHNLEVVASADDFGKVNLYKYPACQPKSTGHIYGGHSSHVTNVKFLYDDSRLLSTGGKDMAILQWEVV